MTDPTTPTHEEAPILVADRITVTFPIGRRRLTAVEDVSFNVARGETVALVGESGSGKTTAALALMREHDVDSGRILFEGADITDLKERKLKPIRRRLQMILQDPYASLDPRMTVGRIVAEPLRAHRVAKGSELEDRVANALEQVGLPRSAASRYPARVLRRATPAHRHRPGARRSEPPAA
jgi:ABC-type glutathione transport system ATPase component